MTFLKFGLLALALLVSSVRQANAGIINGGFETGDFTGWTVDPHPSFPEYIVTSPVHSGTFAAQIAGFSSSPDTLSQTVSTTLGQHYTLSFWREVDDGNRVTSLALSWDNVTIFSELNNGAQPYTQFSFDVVGTGSDTLVFTTANDPSFTYLDDVSLTATATPVPSTLVMSSIFLGICCVVWSYGRLRQPAMAV
jgi:hypothetical protein